MADFSRELNTDIQVEQFVDGILCIRDKKEKRKAINRIASAERNLKDYRFFSTFKYRDNRDFEYRDDNVRAELRERIVNELFELTRLGNDEEISLGKGGAAPNSIVRQEAKAFYVMGPPASGKSGVSSQIADLYGCYILDSDYAKRKLPEYKNQIGAAALVHEESDAIVFGENGLMDHCMALRNNIVIPKIGWNMVSVLKMCNGLNDAGYKVYLISVDLDRQKATQRAYNRFITTSRYVPLSLVFDNYGNQSTLNYFKIKQKHSHVFEGFSQISTDVAIGQPAILVEEHNMEELKNVEWR